MLSLFFGQKWCKPGKGPVKSLQYWQAVPQGDYEGSGKDQVDRFLRNVELMGLPRMQRWRYGEVTFRFIVHVAGPKALAHFYLAIPDIRTMGFKTAFQSAFPDMYLVPLEHLPPLPTGSRKQIVTAQGISAKKGVLSVLPHATADASFPLHQLILGMRSRELCEGEQMWLDMVFYPAKNGQLIRKCRKAEKWLTSPVQEPVSLRRIYQEMTTDKQGSRSRIQPIERSIPHNSQLHELRAKKESGHKGLWTSFRLIIASPESRARLQTINIALQAIHSLNHLRFRTVSPKGLLRRVQEGAPTKPLLLLPSELAGWLHLPGNRDEAFEHVEKARSKMIAAPSSLSHGLLIGHSNLPGKQQEIRIPPEILLKHSFLAGTTGSGKTSTLLAMMLDMVEARRRNPQAAGFTFLDPHGGAIRMLLSHIPAAMHDIVHIIPLGQTERPRGLNCFQGERMDAESVTGEFVSTLQQLFPGSRPRAEHYLRNALLSLMHCPPQTVLGISHILLNEAFRSKIIPRLDQHIRHFWTGEFAQIKNVSEHLGPILNKLGALTTYPSSRRMLGQLNSYYPTRKIMDEGRIVLIDGSGCVPDLLKVISSLFLIDYHFACRKRPQHAARPHFFAADEIHLFATGIIEKILAEDRKFGLSLVLATQYLSQLPENIYQAIMGNVGTMILLQLGGPDADRIARWLKPGISATDLMNLPQLDAIVRTKGEGGHVHHFTMKNNPIREGNPALVTQAWAISDARDGRPIDEVEQEIERMYGSKPGGWTRDSGM